MDRTCSMAIQHVLWTCFVALHQSSINQVGNVNFARFVILGSMEAAKASKAERLTQIRRDREEEYARNYLAKLRQQHEWKCSAARRSLHIGNPILREAIKRDLEAASTEKKAQFKPTLQKLREFETMQMAKEDCPSLV